MYVSLAFHMGEDVYQCILFLFVCIISVLLFLALKAYVHLMSVKAAIRRAAKQIDADAGASQRLLKSRHLLFPAKHSYWQLQAPLILCISLLMTLVLCQTVNQMLLGLVASLFFAELLPAFFMPHER